MCDFHFAPTDDDTLPLEMSTEAGKQTTFVGASSTVEESTTKMASKVAMTTTEHSVTEQRHYVEVKPIVEHVAHNQKSDLSALEVGAMIIAVRLIRERYYRQSRE